MARIMTKEEKAALIETFDFVREAKDFVWVGGRNNRHKSYDAQFTKGGWRKYFMKKDFIMMDCGIPIEIDRPGIKSTVYYDDEYDDPMGGSEESQKLVWMRYNLRYDAPNAHLYRYYGDDRMEAEDFHQSFVYDCKNNGVCGSVVLNGLTYEPAWYSQFPHIPIEPEEVAEYIACLDELTEDYKKRLEAYWKRYRDKIWSHGYWANR